MSTRIYKVTDTQADPPVTVLVRATSQAPALSYAARNRYAAAVAKPDVVKVMEAGGKVHDAGAQQS